MLRSSRSGAGACRARAGTMFLRTVAIVATLAVAAIVLEGLFGVDLGLRDLVRGLMRSAQFRFMPN